MFTDPDRNFAFTGFGPQILFTNPDSGYVLHFVFTSPGQDFTATSTTTSTITNTTATTTTTIATTIATTTTTKDVKLSFLIFLLLLIIITKNTFAAVKSVLNDS